MVRINALSSVLATPRIPQSGSGPSGIVNMPYHVTIAPSVSAKLLEQSCTLAKFAYEMSKFVSQKGARTVCATTTLAYGASHLYSGNVVSGLAIGGCGAKELYEIFKDSMGGKTERLKELLNSAGAGVDKVKELQQLNASSLEFIKSTVGEVEKGVKEVNELMVNIGKLAQKGFVEVRKEKRLSERLTVDAQELFNKANAEFLATKERTETARSLLEGNAASHDKLMRIVSERKDNWANVFVSVAQAMKKRSEKIASCIVDITSSTQRGMEFLKQAQEKQKEAEQAVNRAIAKAEAKLQSISEKSKVQKKYETQISSIKNELREIEERREDQNRILDQISEDLNKAQEELESYYDNTSLLVGGGFGFVAGNAMGGIPGAVIGMKVGAEIVKRRNGVANVTAKAYKFLFGHSNDDDFVKPIKISSSVQYQYYARSTGWFGMAANFLGWKRQSWTCGQANIKIGAKTFTYDFDLNSSRNKIAEKDLIKIAQELAKALKDKIITISECKDIISRLENSVIDRGPARNEKAAGFIQKNNPYFGMLSRSCARALSRRV